MGAGIVLTWVSWQDWLPLGKSAFLFFGLALVVYGAFGFARDSGVLTTLRIVATKPWLPTLRSGELMPLLDLRELATRRGWDLNTEDAVDLVHALNEAGVRGLVEFNGRSWHDHMFESVVRGMPRKPIGKDEWSNLMIDGSTFYIPPADNFDTLIVRRQPYGEKAFADVHLKRDQAERWLRTHAKDYKGRHANSKR